MEKPTRLQHLKNSIDRLEELSNELGARCVGWNKPAGDLDGSRDSSQRFCEPLRSRYEDILAHGETPWHSVS